MTMPADEELEQEVEKRIWQANMHLLDLLPSANAQSWGGSVQAQLKIFGQTPDLSLRLLHHPVVPNVAAITLVKDEADVIGLNLEWLHHLGVRRFVILNNASTDGTFDEIVLFGRRHMADTEVELMLDETLAYIQAEKMTFACRRAIQRWPDIAWLLPFDADEFIQARVGLQMLQSVPAHVEALTILRTIHFRPLGADDPEALGWRELADMSIRSGLFAVPPKVFLRATERLALGKGNHWAQAAPGQPVCYGSGLDYGLFIREFQTRSFAQFQSKVRNGGAAIRAAQALGYELGGEHWLAWEAILRDGGVPALRDEYARVAFRQLSSPYEEDSFWGASAPDVT